MWQVTWIVYGPNGPKLRSITTPSRVTAYDVFSTLRITGAAARIWAPSKKLA